MLTLLDEGSHPAEPDLHQSSSADTPLVDLLMSHQQKGDWESGAESVHEEGEHGVNLKPYLHLFVAAHVHQQLC